ncbi:MAG: biliverdin-producing heme oxygenase, partial [Deltaproteobacteria bacterium]|nr:biliverdin-producing heme oxygenase [Nannocystaceae bacterium]
TGLVAHAYTRYLGDLAGGRMLRRRVSESLGLDASALSFYAFPGIDDVASFAGVYRATIDALGARLATPNAVIEEAALAFSLNIELSDAVARAERT